MRAFGPGIALLAGLLAAGCQSGSPGECKIVHVTDLDVQISRRHLLTPATLNGVATNMVIDTGSMDTLVTKAEADRLGLPIAFTGGRVEGIGGSRAMYSFYAKSFRLGVLHGEDLPLQVSPVELPGFDPPAGGILGSNFHSNYELDFDLADHEMRLFKVLSGCSQPRAVLDPPLFVAELTPARHAGDLRPHVLVKVGGRTLLAVVDSGAGQTVIFRNAAHRLGLRIEDLAEDLHFKGSGIGPHARVAVRHVMTPITIGEITLSNLPVAIVNETMGDGTVMLLGTDFLEHVHVWLSFTSRTLIMQYPPAPSPATHQ